MTKPRLKPVTPAAVNRTVTPRRLPNRDLRTREHLTEAEVERLMEVAKANRHGRRDATIGPSGLPARPTGFRASGPAWGDQVDFRTATLHVRRVKHGTPSTHPILGDELRALRRLQREQEVKSPFVFTSERGAPLHDRRLRPHGRARGYHSQAGLQGPPSHAAARLRLRTRKSVFAA
jgi:integrase